MYHSLYYLSKTCVYFIQLFDNNFGFTDTSIVIFGVTHKERVMTYETKLIYQPEKTTSMVISRARALYLDDAVAEMLDDMKEFFLDKEPSTYIDDLTVASMRESVVSHTPVEYWIKKFGWSF